ncbi:MAG: nuclear pore complex subunit [Salinivirgaceae bacterium]|nr:MAG: nuclear pore complex subunit [Salinivirgaceae bacterium]
MESLILNATEDTPKIVLNKKDKEFLIAERSLPENAFDFYKPVYEWLEKYVLDPLEETEFHVNLDYFNTASAKQLGKIFNLLENIKSSLFVKWHYASDDQDMLESGQRYARLT